MAKKKGKKGHRPHPRPAGEPEPQTRRASAPRTKERDTPARRERKELARKAREAELKRARRRESFRRAGITGVIVLAVFLAFTYLRGHQAGAVSAAAVAAAKDAGCVTTQPQSPKADAPGGDHNPPFVYDQKPATSGPHPGSRFLPPTPQVYDIPQPEEYVIHTLEHGYVVVYYRADGDERLPDDVVEALHGFVEAHERVILMPYPELPAGTSFALTAWNKLWECPASITAQQARTMTSSFVEAYRDTNNAPEPGGA